MDGEKELTSYEIKQQRRAEKQNDDQTPIGARWGRRLGVALIVFSILGGLVYWLKQTYVAAGPDNSKQYADLGQQHIKNGEAHAPYNSNPPSSGPHYVEPALEGYYDAELPDEQLVHNLEHGNIWIAYNPRLAESIKNELKKFDANKIIITPRANNETDIALVAWTRVDAFNLDNGALDTARVENFIKRYINTGPEKLVPSNHK